VKKHQSSLLDVLLDDGRPLHDWVTSMLRLVPHVYPADAQLAAEFEVTIQRLGQIDFACVGTDDPTAPPPGAPAREALAYIFRVDPPERGKLNRLITRVDQIAGREHLLAAARGATVTKSQ
jgi:hypothetical protein